MTRDMDLIREILLLAENTPPTDVLSDFSSLEREDAIILEHIKLLTEAGLLEAVLHKSGLTRGPYVRRLTWQGHDFIVHAKQPALWKRATDVVTKAGAGMTLEVMRSTLTRLAADAVARLL